MIKKLKEETELIDIYEAFCEYIPTIVDDFSVISNTPESFLMYLETGVSTIKKKELLSLIKELETYIKDTYFLLK